MNIYIKCPSFEYRINIIYIFQNNYLLNKNAHATELYLCMYLIHKADLYLHATFPEKKIIKTRIIIFPIQ